MKGALDKKGKTPHCLHFADDDRLSTEDMSEILLASLSAGGMAFDRSQVEEMVAALWEDAGLVFPADYLDLPGLRSLLFSHEGLVEGLLKSMTALLMPPGIHSVFIYDY